MERRLYIAAYDIADDSRRRACMRVTRDFSGDAQQSVYECWLSPRELARLADNIATIIDDGEDRYSLFAVSGSGAIQSTDHARLQRRGDLLLFG